MKNKGLTIFLIVLLSIIVIGIIALLIAVLFGNVKLFNMNIASFKKAQKVSDKLVFEETYNLDFGRIDVDVEAGNIYIKESSDEEVKVVVYNEKDIDVNANGDLSLKVEAEDCIGFCINMKVAKVEIYLPKDYEKTINIKNNYGDIEIENFAKATIDIEEDCGDIFVAQADKLKLEIDAGDVEVQKVEFAEIKSSAGNVDVGTVADVRIDNDLGDINIDAVTSFLDLESDCGDIKVNNIDLKEDSYIKQDLGDVEIGTTNEIYFDAETDLGDVDVRNNYQNSDTTLKIENDCGDITVNN